MEFIHLHFGKLLILSLLSVAFVQSCIPGLYKFNGTSFDPEIKTFYIGTFEIQAQNAPPTITQTFEEALKIKIRRESPLKESDLDPDIEFKGKISNFLVTSEAPAAGELIGFNRLTIGLTIEYIDYFHGDKPEYNWTQTFSFFADFGAEENLLDVQDQLIETISAQIVEDIFNKAFTNW